MSKRPVVLIIRDGWAIKKEKEGNAPLLARTPVHDELLDKYPNTKLIASGERVGLPKGIMGNSEVGHLNLGAGRIVLQESTLISKEIREGKFFDNPALISAMKNVSQKKSKLHIMGLCSDALVHSALEHLYAILTLASQYKLNQVFIHAFLDGRDTLPKETEIYINRIEKKLHEIGIGKIASVCGRYFAMDRDKRWDRVEKAYLLLTRGVGFTANNAVEAIHNAYNRGESDEFVKPTALLDNEKPVAVIDSEDSIIFFNFRADRGRELTKAFTEMEFTGFVREKFVAPHFVTLTEYEKDQKAAAAYVPHKSENIFGEVISSRGLRQLRIAETEKYAHVTFFFNSSQEAPFPGEDRCLIPSPKVATYDIKPEMSAFEVTSEVIKKIESDFYDIIILNFANPDMVGHTGVLQAAVKAVEVVDVCIGKVITSIKKAGGIALITADHGNCELMIDMQTGGPHTAHTTNPVHFILVDDDLRNVKLSMSDDLALADVAPTMLYLMNIPKPAEMSGRNIIVA
ncbi:MAG: 2,3-bisphosphoglycerate-independent phosphoglycerate mutase [Planctomycetota bacterium]